MLGFKLICVSKSYSLIHILQSKIVLTHLSIHFSNSSWTPKNRYQWKLFYKAVNRWLDIAAQWFNKDVHLTLVYMAPFHWIAPRKNCQFSRYILKLFATLITNKLMYMCVFVLYKYISPMHILILLFIHEYMYMYIDIWWRNVMLQCLIKKGIILQKLHFRDTLVEFTHKNHSAAGIYQVMNRKHWSLFQCSPESDLSSRLAVSIRCSSTW